MLLVGLRCPRGGSVGSRTSPVSTRGSEGILWTSRFVRHLVLIGLVLLSGRWSPAQAGEDPSDRYFALLREQPGNSYLYDRFYQAWLDTKTVDQLEAFLKANLDGQKDIGSRLLLALFYERQGQDAKALELYRDVPTDSSVTCEYLFHRARVEARNLNFESAISDLAAARRLSCTSETAEKASRLLGELYIRTNQKDKAAALWRQLLEAGGEHQELCEELIELQIREGLFDDALKTNEELIGMTRDPYKAVMRRLRQGDIHQYKGDTDKALEVYTGAFEMVGEGSWLENQVYAQVERVFERNDNIDGLKDYLTGLVERHPERTGLRRRLADLLLQTGATDEALKMFREMLEVTPGDIANQKAYANILADAGQLDKAIPLLEQLFERDQRDSEILVRLADLYHRNQQDEQAAVRLARFLDLSDKSEYAYLRVAGLLEQYGLRERAGGVYQQMIAALPGNLSVRQVYAEFLYRSNRQEEALRILQTVAHEGDLQMMMRACNAVIARDHADLALPWAEARYREFSNDVTYLNHLCRTAIRLKAFDKALVWAMRQLQMAKDYPMVRTALSQVMAAVDSDEKAGQMVREMRAMDRLTIQQACLLSELLEFQGRPGEADAVLTEAIRTNPEIAMRQQIDLYRARRDWVRVAEGIEKLLARTGTREPNLMRDLVEAYETCGRYEDALQWVRQWKQIAPTSPAPHLYHARLLDAMGRNEEAVAAAEAASREFEGDTEILARLARLYASRGQYEQAQRTYWRLYEAAKDVPGKLGCIRDMAEAAGEVGGLGELIDRLQRQRQRDRASAVPLLALAEVYRQMGKYEERRQALLEASRLQTEDLSLLYELAGVEEAQGDWRGAVQTLERALALDGTSKTRLKIARLHIQHGSREEGFRILTEVAGGERMDPRDAESIADTMMSIGSWDVAARFLQGLLPSHPKDYRLRYQHAVALEEAGQTTEAIETFIDLLSFVEEIPGNTNKATPFAWSRQGVDTHVERILPAEAVELLRLDQCNARAYGHRHGRIRYSRSAAPGPVNLPFNVALPATVDELRDFAVSHILILAESLSEQGKSRVAADLVRHGVAHVDILMAVPRFGLSNLREAIENLAETYPDNEVVQAVWILHRIEGRGCTLKEAQRIFEMFKDTHPRLALIVGLRCYGRDPVASQLFKQSMRMLKDVPDPGYYEIASIAYVLQNSHSSVALTEEQRAFLDRHLIDWYATLNPTVASRIDVFRYVASLLGRRRDLTDFVEFLNQEVARSSSTPNAATTPPFHRPTVWHLSYPPRGIPGFPSHVEDLVLDGPNYSAPAVSRVPRAEPAKLGSYLDKIENPILKILVAITSGRTEDARRLTRALLETDPTSLAAYVLAATQATVDGAPLEVIALLEKARSLPMSTPYRRLLDGALVASAMELDPQKHPDQVDLGRRAALRLMGDSLNPEQREEVLAAAETLGLAEEAQNLRKQMRASTTTPSASSGSPRASGIHPFTVALIERFFERRQTDAAMRLALNHLKNAAHDSLYCHFVGSGTSSMVEDIVRLIHKHGATTQFMELAAGPGEATTRKLVEYGRICELLDRPAEAVAAYEKAVAMDPKNAAARTRLALLSIKTDPRGSGMHLAAIDRSVVNTVGQGLVQQAWQLFVTGRVESALDIARMVTEYLALIEEPEKQNLDWVDRLADAIAQRCDHGAGRLHHLYGSPVSLPNLPGGRSAQSFGTGMIVTPSGVRYFHGQIPMNWANPFREDARIADQRRTVHNALCRRMLEIPQLAEVGFARLAAEAEVRDALTDQYVQMARQAMLTHKPYRQTNPLTAVSRGLPQTSLMDPAEYLVREARKAGTLDKLVSEFAPQLKQNGADDQAAKLTRLADVYTASPDRFFGAADRLLSGDAAQGHVRGNIVADENGPARMIVDAYLTGQPGGRQTMEQFILDKIREDIDQGRFVHHHLAEVWLAALMNRDETSARAFLDAIVTLYSSPKGRLSGLDGVFRLHRAQLDSASGSPGRTQSGPAPVPSPRPVRERDTRTRRDTVTRSRTRSRY